jgi:putative membrane protein
VQGGTNPSSAPPYGYGGYGGYGMGPRPRRSRAWIFAAVALAAVAVVGVLVLLYLDGAFGPAPYGGRPYFGLFGGFFLLVIIVWLAFFLLRISFWGARTQGRYGGGGYGGPRRGPDPAVVIARQRYARGEITREQFDQIMTDLGRRGRGPGGPLSGT